MTTTTNTQQASIEDVLNVKGKKKRGKFWFILLLLLLGAGGAYYYYYLLPQNNTSGSGNITFTTEVLKKGDISVSVTATGNLQPLNQVDIGTELSGTVDDVYVDNNDVVVKGQKLAKLNTTQLEDTVIKATASVSSAKAGLRQVKAKVAQAKASKQQTLANFKQSSAQVQQALATSKESLSNLSRLQKLHKSTHGKLPAKTKLDAARASYERAKASVDAAKADRASVKAGQLSAIANIEAANADVASAQAKVTEAQATLSSAKTNLSKAIIISPINGVVLDRAIEPGQTVAASLSAPTLFTLAEDLSKMELQVSVDEADVGKVKKGQDANFNVDAWSGRQYPAQIIRVNLGADTSSNVVSYVTELQVNNSDLSLRPGMTATASIITEAQKDILLVPTAALRFSPPIPSGPPPGGTEGMPPEGAPPGGMPPTGSPPENNSGGFLSKIMPGPPGRQKTKRKTTTD